MFANWPLPFICDFAAQERTTKDQLRGDSHHIRRSSKLQKRRL